MRIGIRTATLVVAGLMLLSGCGLNVMVMTDPTTAQQGQNVDFTVMVKNQTQCTVSNPVLFVATFISSDVFPDTINFCDFIQEINPTDVGGLEGMLGRVFSPAAIGQVMQTAQDRFFGMSPAGSGQTVPSECMPVLPDMAQGVDPTNVFELECELDDIDPLGKATLTFDLTAPISGPVRTIAIAFGDIPSDEMCRPGAPELGLVAGCFDSAQAVQAAPVMSVAGLGAAVAGLLAIGSLAIRRRRR